MEERVDELGKTCAEKNINLTQIVTTKGNKLHFLGKKKAIERSKKAWASRMDSTIKLSKIKKTMIDKKIKESKMQQTKVEKQNKIIIEEPA